MIKKIMANCLTLEIRANAVHLEQFGLKLMRRHCERLLRNPTGQPHTAFFWIASSLTLLAMTMC